MTDPAALDAEAGPVARLSITAPPAWQGRRIFLQVPRLLACASCCGGGCDACDRRGALEGPSDPTLRRLELQIPSLAAAPVALRLPRPFGASSTLAQLVLVVEEGPPDPRAELRAERAGGLASDPRAGGHHRPWVWAAFALAAVGALALARWAAG